MTLSDLHTHNVCVRMSGSERKADEAEGHSAVAEAEVPGRGCVTYMADCNHMCYILNHKPHLASSLISSFFF